MGVIRQFNSIQHLAQTLCECEGINYYVAIGNFDGVHLGHRTVIERCINLYKQRVQRDEACKAFHEGDDARIKCVSAALTFTPHPMTFFKRDGGRALSRMIMSKERNAELLFDAGIDEVWWLKFDEELISLAPEEFLSELLQDSVRAVITGYNFKFGKGQSGDAVFLRNKSEDEAWDYSAVDEVSYNGHAISSSRIRRMLSVGAMHSVRALTGRPYILHGKVVTMHDNTAIQVLMVDSADKAMPVFGIYLMRMLFSGHEVLGIGNILEDVWGDCRVDFIVLKDDCDIPQYCQERNVKIEIVQLLKPIPQQSAEHDSFYDIRQCHQDKDCDNILQFGLYVAECMRHFV